MPVFNGARSPSLASAAAGTAADPSRVRNRSTEARRDSGVRTSAGPFLFRSPTGLADGLALKEQRYAGDHRRFAPGHKWPMGPPFPSRARARTRLGSTSSATVAREGDDRCGVTERDASVGASALSPAA